MTDRFDEDTKTRAPSANVQTSFKPLAMLFFNQARRLRSGWRALLFLFLFFVLWKICSKALVLGLSVVTQAMGIAANSALITKWRMLLGALVVVVVSFIVGWLIGRVCEDLPARSLGWSFHKGWWRDLLVGSLIGALAMLAATLLAAATGGYVFSLNPRGFFASVLPSLVVSLVIFVPAAAAEQALFTGYAFQTLLRSHSFWLVAVLSAMLFGFVHLGNPSVAPGFTFWNTTLAGIWFAVAFWRTRSLWFVLGLHWAWNWTQGALLGIPVSGITEVVDEPLLRAVETGSDFVTGGAYGIEGGAACTVVIIAFTFLTWRTRLLRATPEMKSYSDREQSSIAALR